MRKKLLTTAAAALLISGLTSCVYDRDETPVSANANGSLTITIKSDNFDAPLTRALTTDPGTATENTITADNTVIAIFDGTGTLIKSAVPSLVSGKLSLSYTENGTNWLANAAEVYVAANLPAAKVTALTALGGTATKATFASTLYLEEADALNANSLAGTMIPMFGKGTISNGGANNYTATVNVEHMLTKITLNSLGVDFSQSDMPNASFQPEQVFLTNVPDNVTIDESTGAIKQAAPTDWYFGEVAGADNDGANNNTGANHAVPDYATDYASKTGYDAAHQFNVDENLGTGALSGQTVMSAENPVWLSTATAGSQALQKYYFYTMPNTTATTATTKQTNLVIRGAFKSDPSAAATEVYYAVPLSNSATDASSLDPNKNYQIDVIIKQKGAADAYAALPNEVTARMVVSYNLTTFVDNPTSISIGNGAKTTTPGIENVARVGDYFYSDGTWSTIYDNTKTLVGLVFSTNVSATDQANGYTHGYVVALTDCGYDYNGGTPTITKYKCRDYTPTTSGDKAPGFTNIGATVYDDDAAYWAEIKADLDGASHTATMLADANEAEYLAAHAANDYNTSYPVAGTNSGWYLPSLGQLYELCYNFAGRTVWTGLNFVVHKARLGQFNEYHNCVYQEGSYVTITAMNNYLTARLVTAAGLTAEQDYQPFIAPVENTSSSAYWSSSDYSLYEAFYLGFFNSGNLDFHCYPGNEPGYVRPVLAF